jgi:hypothetical protein
MIVKLQKAGSSFKGLTSYLTEQKDRVAWTHSLNCANDDVRSVAHEMYTTYSQAELLKQEAGVHAGGTLVETPVKHISLNWHPDEKPTQEHMIATAEAFLKEMGWDEHQALLVAHSDRAHSHVHIELNRIHPETGKVLDDSFERRRASDWALDYEREHGLVRCPQREKDYAERSPSPTRETWQTLREAEEQFERNEQAERERAESYLRKEDRTSEIRAHEWQILKDHQRAEREAHFAEGRIAFRELRHELQRDVREHFRQEWGDYYAACRDGLGDEDAFAWKADIVARQRDMFEGLKAEAFGELRTSRDGDYRQLLLDQKEERHELHQAQDAGLTSYDLLNFGEPEREPKSDGELSEPANQNDKSEKPDAVASEDSEAFTFDSANDNSARLKDGLSGLGDMGAGLIGGLSKFVERLFDSLLDGRPAPKVKQAPPEPNDELQRRREALRFQKIEEAIEQAELERERQREDTNYRERQRSRD